MRSTLRKAIFLSVLMTGLIGLVSGASADPIFAIGENFTGSSISQSGFIPPDTMGAVGPNHVVELINGRYAAYNKSGTVQQSSSLNSFWASAGVTPAGSFAFDPRILYDSFSEKWFAVSVDNAGGANNLLVAVSQSSNPTTGWSGFQIDADSNNTHWADFPMLGLNGDVVAVQSNMFPISSGSSDRTTLVIPKSDLVSATPTVANATVFEETRLTNNPGFTAQPIVDLDNGNLPLKLLSAWNKSSGSLKTSTIQGTPTSPSLNTSGGFISVTGRGSPPDVDQPGAKQDVDAGDNRFSGNVIKQHVSGRTNPSLWGAHGVEIDGRAAIEWYEIDAVTNVLLQSGTISDPGLAFSYPSIAVNDNGDVVIGFSGGDPSTFLSTYVVVGETVAGITTFGPHTLTKAGTGDYQRLDGIGRNRWGDYSSTVIDPTNDQHFWTFQEFASGNNNWSVQITEIRVGPAAVPEPSTLLLMGIGITCLVGGARFRRRRR